MAKDERTYIKVHDGMPEHPKFVAVGGDAGWLHVCALGYCSRYLTDGMLPKAMVPRISDRKTPAKLAAKLVAHDIWHAHGHDCDRCPQPGPDDYVIHDYLEHQRSAEEVEALRRKRQEAGRKGGKSKATKQANAKQVLEQEPEHLPEQTASKSVPVTEVLTDVRTQTEPTPPVVPPAEPPPASANSPSDGRRAGLTPLPDDWSITDGMRRWAHRDGYAQNLDLDHETAQFVSHYRSTGTRRTSWPDAWQKWIRDSAKRAAERRQRSATNGHEPSRNAQILQAAYQRAQTNPDGRPELPWTAPKP